MNLSLIIYSISTFLNWFFFSRMSQKKMTKKRMSQKKITYFNYRLRMVRGWVDNYLLAIFFFWKNLLAILSTSYFDCTSTLHCQNYKYERRITSKQFLYLDYYCKKNPNIWITNKQFPYLEKHMYKVACLRSTITNLNLKFPQCFCKSWTINSFHGFWYLTLIVTYW